MWWFTLFFGMFGLHHLLLRSPQTALVFAVANFFTLGYMYFYDLIQLSTYGGNTTETLNKNGLQHPWGALGLAQGMWTDPPPSNSKPAKPDPNAPPSPWWFFLYAFVLPLAPLALLIAGDTKNALSRFSYLTIIPFGLLGFLFYGISILADYWTLLAKPADLLVFGAKRFFPFTFFGMDGDGHSPRLTLKRDLPEPICPPAGNPILGAIFEVVKFVLRLTLPVLYVVNPPAAASLDAALNTTAEAGGKIVNAAKVVVTAAETAAETAVTTADIATDVAVHAVEDGTKVIKTVGKLAGNIQGLSQGGLASAAAAVKDPKALLNKEGLANIKEVVKNPQALLNKQEGGGKETKSTLDWLALGSLSAVVLGGFLLAGGRSLQNANTNARDDTPPGPDDA